MIETRDQDDMSQRTAVCVHSASGLINSVHLCTLSKKKGWFSKSTRNCGRNVLTPSF